MKVLQINSVCGVGSTGRIATDIHNILIDQGHESYIAYGRGIAKDCDTAIRIGSDIDNYLHVAKTRIFDSHGFGSKRATVKLINKITEINPDIIQLHNIHGYYLHIESFFDYLKSSDKKVFWTLHDCWSFTGHCSYFDYVDCNRWKSSCYKCPQKKKYPSSFFIDRSKENYLQKKYIFNGVKNMTLVTPSKWLANIVKQSFLNEYPVEVINNGIDLEMFKPTHSQLKHTLNIKNKFIILGVASIWEKRKGYEYFMELSKIIEEDEVIILVGVTDEQKRDLPKNVIGITKTNNVKELAEIYSIANVFVNPTLEDNFPTTNLESLACGTPIITFDTGGSIESIDSKCGFITEKGNLMGMKKIIEMIKEKGKKEFEQYCVEKAKVLYDKKEKYNEYIEHYKKVIQLNKN